MSKKIKDDSVLSSACIHRSCRGSIHWKCEHQIREHQRRRLSCCRNLRLWCELCQRLHSLDLYESARKFVGWPITPGFEFSGEIESKGENVTNFKIGQNVFGVSVFGAYSKRIKVLKHQIFPLPENFDTNEAAGFLTVALTAWYGMFELSRPELVDGYLFTLRQGE